MENTPNTLEEIQASETEILKISNELESIITLQDDSISNYESLIENARFYNSSFDSLSQLKKYFSKEFSDLDALDTENLSKLEDLNILGPNDLHNLNRLSDIYNLLLLLILFDKVKLNFYSFEGKNFYNMMGLVDENIKLLHNRLKEGEKEKPFDLVRDFLLNFRIGDQDINFIKIYTAKLKDYLEEVKNKSLIFESKSKLYGPEFEILEDKIKDVLLDLFKKVNGIESDLGLIRDNFESLINDDDEKLKSETIVLLEKNERFLLNKELEKINSGLDWEDLKNEFEVTYSYWIYNGLDESRGLISELSENLDYAI